MADKDVATDTWGAVLVGITVALVLTLAAFTGLSLGVLLLIGVLWLMAGALARTASHSELD